MKMRKPKTFNFEKQFINRQYNDTYKFTDYNELIKKLQCNYVLSFSDCSIPSILQDNYEVPVSTCKFSNKNKYILAVANENGIVCIENIEAVQTLKYVQTHENTVYDIGWMPGNSQFVTVSGDNSAKLWDCREADVNLVSTFNGHKRSVRCVSFKPENTAVFATGSRDGSLMIWDTRASKKCAKFSHHIPDQVISSGAGSPLSTIRKTNIATDVLNSKSVTGLVFQNDNTLISCGSMDKFIRIWDMRKTYSRSVSNSVAKHQLSSPNSGFSYISMNTLGTKLYANCMDSYIYCYNINSYDPRPGIKPVSAFYGHENGSFYVKSSVSNDGLYLMSGSSNECAYIWNTNNAELLENAVKPLVVLNSHTAEVTCIEMSPDRMVIVTCSDDGTFRLWNPFPIKNQDRDKVDVAACYDVEEVTTVKTQWRNKRKFKEIEECESEVSKTSDCPHIKICRFYMVNHSSTCICHTKFTQGKGEKRSVEEIEQKKSTAKKKAVLEMQERTPPRQENSKFLFSSHFPRHTTPQKVNNIPLRLSSKRKLEDMPNFIEEIQKNKKMDCGVLVCSNATDKSAEDLEKTFGECYKSEWRSSVRERTLVEKNVDRKSPLTTLSSPTSNLPNYVEDGTSPYIHRCPKVTQKENDWLTKLRKKYKLPKTPEGKPLSPCITTPPKLERKKKEKSLDYTLHKYFKVSSKATEKSFNSVEIQKKGVLAASDSQ